MGHEAFPEVAQGIRACQRTHIWPFFRAIHLTIIAPMKPEAYRGAVAVLGRIQELALRLQQPGLFTMTQALVMTGHARKKNLVTLIRKAGLA